MTSQKRSAEVAARLFGRPPAHASDAGARVAQVAILLMVAGAVIAGLTDLTYSLPGYLWVSVCAVSTAVYLLLIRLLKDRTGAPPEEVQAWLG